MNTDIEKYLAQNQSKADKYISIFIIAFFLFGITIAPIYDTWMFALGIGGINIVLFFGTFFLKNKYIGRMIVSVIFALYMLQFIGQMHGMAELHFFFFTNIAILIIYQDWRLMIPYTIITIAHHSIFFAFQLSGAEGLGTYFINYTKVTYFTLIFHYIPVVFMAIVCGLWAHLFRQTSYKIFVLEQQLNIQKNDLQENADFLLAISQGDFSKHINPKNEIEYALFNTKKNLEEAAQKDKTEQQRTKRLLEISEALRNHYNIASLGESIVKIFLKTFEFASMAVYHFQKNTDKENTENKDFLKLIAQLGCSKEDVQEAILLGEGLLGEVAITKKTKYFDFIQEMSPVLKSGIGQTKAPFTFIIPLSVNDMLVGVISIASFKAINNTEKLFLEEISYSIARTFVAVETINENEMLLQQSQHLTQELKSSEEELRQNLEEVNTIRDAMENVTFELTSQLQDKEQKIELLEKQVKTLLEAKNSNKVV